MACNGCTKRFGLFLKENGCPSCKYSFCSKCLKFRIKIAGRNKDVCLRCFELAKSGIGPNTKKDLTMPSNDISILDVPIESHSKTADMIKPETVSDNATSIDEDAVIRERLAALKQIDDGNQQVTEVSTSTGTSLIDIEKRLAALKGLEYKDYTALNKKILLQKDNRSEEEQIRDIMAQFAQEQEIHDSMSNYRLAAIEDIENRLAALKDVSVGGPSDDKPKLKVDLKVSDSGEENEDEAAKKLALQYMEEAAIDHKRSSQEDETEQDILDIPTSLCPSDTEELPWCTICNEDAIIRCVSCGGDLFCRSCFRECHDDDEDYRKHKTELFKAVTKSES